MRVNNEEKLKMVRRHLNEGITLKELSSEYKFQVSSIKYLVALYQIHGEKVFTNRELVTRHDREEKLKAIKRVIEKGEVQRQIALEMGLIDPSIIKDWLKLYRKQGEEAIKTTYGRKSYELKEDKINKIEDKRAKERLKYLEAENAYLKKLYSLMLKRGKTSKKE